MVTLPEKISKSNNVKHAWAIYELTKMKNVRFFVTYIYNNIHFKDKHSWQTVEKEPINARKQKIYILTYFLKKKINFRNEVKYMALKLFEI